MRQLVAIVAFLLAAPAVQGTVLVPAEFREIVGGSEIIAHGRVIDVRPEWAQGRRRIDSVVTVEVFSSFKGGAGRTVSFRTPGGQIGRYRSVTVGAPVFEPGDEAVFFLDTGTESGATLPHVFGLSQGVFRVRVDSRSGRRMVVTPAVIALAAEPQVVRRGALSRRPVPLDAFGALVRAAMQAAPGGAR